MLILTDLPLKGSYKLVHKPPIITDCEKDCENSQVNFHSFGLHSGISISKVSFETIVSSLNRAFPLRLFRQSRVRVCAGSSERESPEFGERRALKLV